MWYIVTAEFDNWCGFTEKWKVKADSVREAEDKVERTVDEYMRNYIGEPDEGEEEYDDYGANSMHIEEWDWEEHGSLEHYEELE